MFALVAQPTMFLDARSMIAAGYSHPSPVAMYVMSETHFRFGSGDSKFLFRMFGEKRVPVVRVRADDIRSKGQVVNFRLSFASTVVSFRVPKPKAR